MADGKKKTYELENEVKVVVKRKTKVSFSIGDKAQTVGGSTVYIAGYFKGSGFLVVNARDVDGGYYATYGQEINAQNIKMGRADGEDYKHHNYAHAYFVRTLLTADGKHLIGNFSSYRNDPMLNEDEIADGITYDIFADGKVVVNVNDEADGK